MWKRIIVFIFIFFSILNFSSHGYANKETPAIIDPTKYEVLKPEKESYSTTDKVILLNGKAPSGTEITIEVYGTIDLDSSKKTFNLDKLPTEKDYILSSTEKITSGNIGIFQKQMDLVKGINKVVLNFGVEGIESKEFIVYVYEKIRTENKLNINRDFRFNDIMPLLK